MQRKQDHAETQPLDAVGWIEKIWRRVM